MIKLLLHMVSRVTVQNTQRPEYPTENLDILVVGYSGEHGRNAQLTTYGYLPVNEVYTTYILYNCIP